MKHPLKTTPSPWFVVKNGQRLTVTSLSGDIAELVPLNGEEVGNAALIAKATSMEEYEALLQRFIEGDMNAEELGEQLQELFETREAFATVAKASKSGGAS